MNERYTRLFSLPGSLYTPKAPLLIMAGALLKDNITGQVLAQVKYKNLQTKPIKALTVSLQALDTRGLPLGEPVEHQYLDLSAPRDSEFGQKEPIPFPDASTRGFSAQVRQVIFSDNSIWEATETPWESLSLWTPLEDALQDRELVQQYRIQYGQNCKYLFKREKDLWQCACGALNQQEEEQCHKCGKSAAALGAMDLDELKAARDKRLAMEREMKRQQAEEARAAAEAKAKRNKKRAIMAIPAAAIVIVAGVFLSDYLQKNATYHDALTLLKTGEYDKAHDAFLELGDFKDSPRQAAEATQQKIDANYQKRVTDFIDLMDSYDSFTPSDRDDFESKLDEFIRWDASSESQKEGKYQLADALYQNELYEEAIRVFDSLGDYSDSAEQKEKIQDLLDEELYTRAVSLFSTAGSMKLTGWEGLLETFNRISPDYKDTAQYVEQITSLVQTLKEIDGTYYGRTYTVDGETRRSYFTISESGSQCETDQPARLVPPFTLVWDKADDPLTWGIKDGKIYGFTILGDGYGNHVIKRIFPDGNNSILVVDDTSHAGEKYNAYFGYGGSYITYDGISYSNTTEETYVKE